MSDKRKLRGPHPEDRELFSEAWLPLLRRALEELCWLQGRGYPLDSAIRLVGDHHQLEKRQRLALCRSAATKFQVQVRRAKRVEPQNRRILVDGFNALITVEAALSRGLLIRGLDGWIRDLASVHGSYRTMSVTQEAILRLQQVLEPAAEVVWLFDQPVSNSGRAAGLVREMGGLAEVSDKVDQALIDHDDSVVTSDGPVLDRAVSLIDAVGSVVSRLKRCWLVDLRPDKGL